MTSLGFELKKKKKRLALGKRASSIAIDGPVIAPPLNFQACLVIDDLWGALIIDYSEVRHRFLS